MSAAYSAYKAGVLGFMRSVAKRYGEYGITANAAVPGWAKWMTWPLLKRAASGPVSMAEPSPKSRRFGHMMVRESW